MLTPSQTQVLKEFSKILKKNDFFNIFAMHETEQEKIKFIAKNFPYLSESLKLIVSFFTLNQPALKSKINSLIPSHVIQCLIDLNIITEINDELKIKGLRLIVHYGIVIFCDSSALDAKRYYGTDSMMLGRMIQAPKGKVLDLCSGIGSQGILCANTAKSVVSVELQPEVCDIFEINIFLNDAYDRVELRIGDFLNPIRYEQFNTIYCNPPFLPVPDKYQLPSIANGGKDGLKFIKSLLKNANELLEPEGEIFAIGMCFGNEAVPFLREIESISKAKSLHLQIVLLFKVALDRHGRVIQSLAKMASFYSDDSTDQILDAYENDFCKMGATYLYSFQLTARYNDTHPGISLIKSMSNPYVNEFEDRILP